MSLAFLNPSRSFDEVKNAVRFMGHDGMFEVPFFIEAAAVAKAAAKTGRTMLSEAECLAAFDTARKSIHDVARQAYSQGRRTYYTLTAADFR